MKYFIVAWLFLFCSWRVQANHILIPMDNTQTDHLKAYGIAYWVLAHSVPVDWLLNYRGGSFCFEYAKTFETELQIRGVSFQVISPSSYNTILSQISAESANMDAIKLEKVPKIAVYSPKTKQPWDDAVTLVLTHAEIPYDVVYDDEVIADSLKKYDWLHLHHEDFTGQYGKFYASFANAPWYKEEVAANEECAKRNGFTKVSQLKLAVALKIRSFVENGGFLFAMCSATDSYDIALAAAQTDICDVMFDHDPIDPQCQQKLDFSLGFAFENYLLEKNPMVYEYSTIDVPVPRPVTEDMDYFTLFDFSAKWDPVPTMLCQNHTYQIKGFMGQTTAFRKQYIKPDVLILGEFKAQNEARYIHGNLGRGMWTFYGGHDPEDYQHHVGEDPTDLELHKNSPGYRLILNNILFPAAKKKKQKT